MIAARLAGSGVTAMTAESTFGRGQNTEGGKVRTTVVPKKTFTGYPQRAELARRVGEALKEQAAGANPQALLFPAPQGGLQWYTSFESDLLQRTKVGRHFFGLRIVPLAQLSSKLKQPGEPIWTLEAGASYAPKIHRLLREIFCRQALPQGIASRFHERSVGKCSDQPNQQPMPVHRRMPIVATVECRRELPRRSHIGIAAHRVADVIGVLFVDTGECEIRKALSSLDVEISSCIAG